MRLFSRDTDGEHKKIHKELDSHTRKLNEMAKRLERVEREKGIYRPSLVEETEERAC